MNLHTVSTGCLAIAITAVGCSGPTGYTAFAVTLSSDESSVLNRPTAATSIQLGGGKCILWSATRAQPRYTPENYYRCSGSHPLPDGQSVGWHCKTRDGRTFSEITIDSKPYDLAKGRLFLLSQEAGTVRVMQLDPDSAQLQIAALDDVAKNDPEIRGFFGTSDRNAGNE